jgi:hypothetical protein
MGNENKSVWSQEKEVQENISEIVEENASDIEESVEDVKEELAEPEETIKEEVTEIEESTEKEVAEAEEETSEEVEEDLDSQVKKMKKHDAANLLVKKAKVIVDDAEGQLEKCKLLLADDLKEYEVAKTALKEGGLAESEALLSKLKYEDDSEVPAEEDSVVFETKDDLEPIRLKDVSSGKFTGFIMGLLGGAATFGGMAFIASEKLGKSIDLSQLTTTLEPVFSWYSRLIGLKGDVFYGRIFMILVALLVAWLIYKIRVNMKASSNLNHAKEQLKAAEEYTAQKSSCKEEMDKVDAHIHDAITTLKTYQILLNEQKGKLQRILHIEGEKDELSEYHQKSISEMQNTQDLINSIKSFMATTMSEEGKLSDKSTLFLHSAKNKMQKTIDRLY